MQQESYFDFFVSAKSRSISSSAVLLKNFRKESRFDEVMQELVTLLESNAINKSRFFCYRSKKIIARSSEALFCTQGSFHFFAFVMCISRLV
jgi:hypothetical protein